jgi:hypothetical protein
MLGTYCSAFSLTGSPTFDFGCGQRVEDIGFGGPAAGGGGHTKTHEIKSGNAVSVGSEDELDSGLDGHFAVGILEVQTPWVGVYLEGGVRLAGVFDYSRNVDIHRFPLANESAGRMGNAVHVRIVHCLQCAGGYLLARASEAGVYRSDYEIEFGEQFVIKVERVVGKNVNFGSRQDGYSF